MNGSSGAQTVATHNESTGTSSASGAGTSGAMVPSSSTHAGEYGGLTALQWEGIGALAAAAAAAGGMTVRRRRNGRVGA